MEPYKIESANGRFLSFLSLDWFSIDAKMEELYFLLRTVNLEFEGLFSCRFCRQQQVYFIIICCKMHWE